MWFWCFNFAMFLGLRLIFFIPIIFPRWLLSDKLVLSVSLWLLTIFNEGSNWLIVQERLWCFIVFVKDDDFFVVRFVFFWFGDGFSFFVWFFGRVNVVNSVEVRADIIDGFELLVVSFGSDPRLEEMGERLKIFQGFPGIKLMRKVLPLDKVVRLVWR